MPTEPPTGTPTVGTEPPTGTPTGTPTGAPTDPVTEAPTGTPTEPPTDTPTATPSDSSIGEFCEDLWGQEGPGDADRIEVDEDWQPIFTADQIQNLKGLLTLNAAYVMAFTATNTCNGPVEIGFSGNGGWLKVTIEKGSDTFYRVEGSYPSLDADKAYSIRSGGDGCGGGTLTLSNIELHPVACAPTWAPTLTRSPTPATKCCVVPKNGKPNHGSWHQYSMIAFSSDNDAISSKAKNVYCNVATPGGYDNGGNSQASFQIGTNHCSEGFSSIGQLRGIPTSAIKHGKCVGPTCFADTGFYQQDFVDYASQLEEHTYTDRERWAVKIFPGQGPWPDKQKSLTAQGHTTATNRDCGAPNNMGFQESQNPVKCLLVFPEFTSHITINTANTNPQKPSFAILAPLALVKTGNTIGFVDGVIVADKIRVKGGNANEVQLHGFPMVGGDEIPCSCA